MVFQWRERKGPQQMLTVLWALISTYGVCSGPTCHKSPSLTHGCCWRSCDLSHARLGGSWGEAVAGGLRACGDNMPYVLRCTHNSRGICCLNWLGSMEGWWQCRTGGGGECSCRRRMPCFTPRSALQRTFNAWGGDQGRG